MTTQSGKSYPLFLVFSLYLIARFLWAVLVPSGEWPLSPSHYLSMALDLGLLVGMIGVRSRVVAGLAPNDGRRVTVGVLLALGIISGLGLLAIRFTSNHGWWTGHLRDGIA